MAGSNFVHFLSIFIFLALTTTTTGSITASPLAVKAAYWPSWDSNFSPSAIDTSLFTHIYYAFLLPSNVTFKFEISNSTAMILSNFTTTLRHKNPPVKTLVSIGGANVEQFLFSRMASSTSSRRTFINSAMEVARKFGFDGLDMDWEFPQSPEEMQDLGLLLEEWRVAIKKEAKATCRPALLFTAAVYFSVNYFPAQVYSKYPVASITKNLDWINAMCFDYRGSWDTTATGAHAALFDPNSNYSTSYGLKSWIEAGVPKKKVVMGLPLYGKTWQLKDPNLYGIGAPAVDVGPGDLGQMTFSQVVEFNRQNGATVVHDLDTVSTYSFLGTSWIGYDDAISATLKIGYAQALGLRGYFFWAVNGDSEWKISKQASRTWIKP